MSDTPFAFADDLSIEQLVRAVSDELLDAQENRLKSGATAVFEVSNLTLEISFVVATSKKAGGGLDLRVVKADAGVQYDSERVHKVTLTLAAVADQEQPFGGFGPVRPRMDDEDYAGN